ncbi:MAG: LysM peptidoglycan-binding domain-containing protein [Candidatus Omnitrophica bacterium]|nr:LysM peptidoglycan-binding domain-containing protein [Candidatus Omnitrophota bacterium]
MVTPEEAAPVPIILPEEVYKEADAILPPEPVKVEPVAEDVKSISYKVKKGDTLQKISKKVYGTSKRWQEIFEFNKGSLKNPNKIYPGQTILIPQD